MKRLFSGILFVFIIYNGSFVFADRIILENGDRLTGTVVGIDNGVLTIKTDYSEPLKIQASKIKKIFTDTPVEVHLSEGEILKGNLSTVEDGKMVIETSDERETTVFYWNKVKAINPPEKSKWTGDITLSGNHQSGNTDRTGASLGIKTTRKTEKDRFSLRFLYNYAKEEGDVSARNTYGAFKYDYFFTKKTYGLISVALLSDEFKDLNLRTVVGPGIGYQVWDMPDKSLGLEAGISYFSEDRKKTEDEHWVTGRLAGNVTLKIFEQIIFTNYLLIYPSFEDLGEYQLRNEAAVASALTSDWSLKLTNIIEHDSDPPVDVEENDIYWLLGLAYNF
jgi:putative salt-induced outer membrane protein YdiY